jgi:hypothetical protein
MAVEVEGVRTSAASPPSRLEPVATIALEDVDPDLLADLEEFDK